MIKTRKRYQLSLKNSWPYSPPSMTKGIKVTIKNEKTTTILNKMKIILNFKQNSPIIYKREFTYFTLRGQRDIINE